MRVFLSFLFFPITIFYGIGVYFRNKFYDYGWCKSQKHNVTTIGVGNLRAGGTGKTPHVEYLIEVLSKEYNIAVLSRGYGRKTKGFRQLNLDNDTALTVGDEPLQMKRKYPEIIFAVCEDRNKGIKELEKRVNGLELVILDDVFQHRALDLDLSILLTEYSRPFFKDKVLPFGMLREQKKGYKRADYILITKSPESYTMGDRLSFEADIKPKKYQKVFFSHIEYKPLYLMSDNEKKIDINDKKVILLTGVADNSKIIEYLCSKAEIIDRLEYADHYNFSDKDIDKIISLYNTHKDINPIIITTEKDAVRLLGFEKLNNIPIYVLPIGLIITSSVTKSISFKEIILDDVRKNKSYDRIYQS